MHGRKWVEVVVMLLLLVVLVVVVGCVCMSHVRVCLQSIRHQRDALDYQIVEALSTESKICF